MARAAGYDVLPLAARARVALEPFVRRARCRGRRIGRLVLRAAIRRATVPLIAAPLLGGIHAGQIDALSMQSLFPRFVEAETTSRQRAARFPSQPRGRRADGAFRIAVFWDGRAGIGDRPTAATGERKAGHPAPAHS